MAEEKLVLIDTDAGTDDAWAIFMCLEAHRNEEIPFRVVGITCVQGNTSVGNIAVNVTRTLLTDGENEIPIYQGAEFALVQPIDLGEDPWNGRDGFGDAELPPLEPRVEEEHGVQAIIRLAELHKGKLSILALGPLTNLAMALRLKPEIKTWVKEICILGGNHSGLGNTTMLAEFNFYADVEAANVVLKEFGGNCPIYIFPWETCVQNSFPVSYRKALGDSIQNPKMELLNKIEANILEKLGPNGDWVVGDAMAAAVLIEPTLITQGKEYYCTVELAGNHSRGLMAVDKALLTGQPVNCTVVEKIDALRFENMLLWAVGVRVSNEIQV